MSTTLEKYVVNAPYVGITTGVHPQTGIDRVEFARRGEQVEFDPDDEHTKKLLAKKYIRHEGEMTDAEQARVAADEQAAANLTKKEKLQQEAARRGIAFEEKTTIPQLEALIAEDQELKRDETLHPGQDGSTGGDPDAGAKK